MAQLKLQPARRIGDAWAASPRLHRRGPIEAVGPVSTGAAAAADLHAFTGVAQLKPVGPLPVFWRRRYLHAFTGVAQLKPCPFCLLVRMSYYLHAFTGVAQLKQG